MGNAAIATSQPRPHQPHQTFAVQQRIAAAARQPPPQAQSQVVARGPNVQSAPIVKSLVALNTLPACAVEDCGRDGFFLRFCFSSRCSGEAAVAIPDVGEGEAETGPQAGPLLIFPALGDSASRTRFEAGQQQPCRLLLCRDLQTSLGARAEDKWHAILELRADSGDSSAVTVQRSYLKVNGSSALLVKQVVQCGRSVAVVEKLFGTLPNPRALASGGCDDGECVICLSKPKEVAILHCRHVCLCRSCAAVTSSTWSFQCPVCRGRVAGMVCAEIAASQAPAASEAT